MKSLAARLLVALLAAVLVGLVVMDLAFIFHTETQITRERRTLQQAVAEQLGGAPNQVNERQVLAERYGFIITPQNDSVSPRLALPKELPAGAFFVAGPYEHYSNTQNSFVVSRLRQEGMEQALEDQGRAVIVLLAAGAVMVLFGFFFLRRVVLSPLLRMTEHLHKDDNDALASLATSPTDHISQLSHAIIAQRQRINDQVLDLTYKNVELETAQNHLVRAERLAVVGQLAAGVAHEVGNPLTVLSGFVQLLGDEGLSQHDRTQALARMTRELDRIAGTIRGLLDFSRAAKDAHQPGELVAVLTHVQALLAPQDKLKRIEVRWPTLQTPITTTVSSDALTQLLLNLLLNAADALDGTGTVEVSVAAANNKVVLRVDDSGPGVEEALRPRIFEPFFTTKPAGKGTGLGLAVCESIVSRGAGDIHVEASPLGGAAFVITLPVRGKGGQA